MIESLLGFTITWSMVIGVMVKIVMVLLSILTVVMVRQTELMDKVINIPVGGSFKTLTWSMMVVTLAVTAIVIVVA